MTDELGEPVVDVTVRVSRLDGAGRIALGPATQTDDRGQYHVGNLAPGDYVVSVPSTTVAVPTSLVAALENYNSAIATDLRRDSPTSFFVSPSAGPVPVGDMQLIPSAFAGSADIPPPGADDRLQIYPTTFHPAAASPAGASAVSLAPGQERTGVDVQLRLTRAYRISGVALGPDGPVPSLGLRLQPAFVSQLQSDSNYDTAVTATAGDGRFSFLGVPPGQYRDPRPAHTATAGSSGVRGPDRRQHGDEHVVDHGAERRPRGRSRRSNPVGHHAGERGRSRCVQCERRVA